MEKALSIAETFHSLQGEGQWVGTPMFFIRLAGCNVGRSAKALKMEPFPILPTGREAMVCTSWDGRSFPCDTDYSLYERKTPEELISECWEKHICLTGGEPLLHYEDIENLFVHAFSKDITIHIETSGTIIPRYLGNFHKLLMSGYWIACSPKIGARDEIIRRSDELKLLVDEEFRFDRLTPAMKEHKNVFLCPINEVSTVNQDNVNRCIELIKYNPTWRVSVQLHKFLGLR